MCIYIYKYIIYIYMCIYIYRHFFHHVTYVKIQDAWKNLLDRLW